MNKSTNEFSGNLTISIVTTIVLLIIAIIGICALSNGSCLDDPFEQKDLCYTQDITDMNYYYCPNCNTIIPCPTDYNRNGILCPSCGLRMNCIERNRTTTQNTTRGSNLYATGGLGRNSGLGSGFNGNLVCPDCGYIRPHQIGIPSFSIQCPKCGTSMARQLTANIPTAFFRNGRNSNNTALQRGFQTAAPPITSNAIMKHQYRGVCSKCHQIIDRPRY